MPSTISISPSVESATNERKLHEEFRIDNKPTVRNNDDTHIENVKQGEQPLPP